MTPKFDEVVSRLKSLIAKSDDLLSRQEEDPFYSKPKEKIFIVDLFGFAKFSTASLHFIETTLGKGYSILRRVFKKMPNKLSAPCESRKSTS